MSARPWMSFYVADYLADTTHLTTAEHGAYLLLIFAYWQSGEALPDDDRKLSRLARMSPRDWEKVRLTVSEFFSVNGGLWSHKRIDREMSDAEEKYQRRALAGSKGGQRKAEAMARPHSSIATTMPEQSDVNAEAMLYQLQPQPPREDTSPLRVDVAREPSEFAAWWSAYPHKIGRAVAEKAFLKARKATALLDLLAGVERYIATKPADREWCNPATWLNQARWLDEPGAPAAARSNAAATARYSNASLVSRLLEDIDHDHDSVHAGRNGAALHRTEGAGERGSGPLLPEGHLRLAGPDEAEPD